MEVVVEDISALAPEETLRTLFGMVGTVLHAEEDDVASRRTLRVVYACVADAQRALLLSGTPLGELCLHVSPGPAAPRAVRSPRLLEDAARAWAAGGRGPVAHVVRACRSLAEARDVCGGPANTGAAALVEPDAVLVDVLDASIIAGARRAPEPAWRRFVKDARGRELARDSRDDEGSRFRRDSYETGHRDAHYYRDRRDYHDDRYRDRQRRTSGHDDRHAGDRRRSPSPRPHARDGRSRSRDRRR